MYLFLWCVWFRLKVQRHKETKMKKQTNSHTSEQGQVYSRQRVLIWKAFRSCSQTKCRKEKQCFHYLSVIHVRMTYLFSADHLLMKHELMDRSVGRRRGSWYNNYSPPQTKSSKLMEFFCRWLPANILKVIGYITVNSPFLGLEKWMRWLIGSH